jgi:uncharacterized protein YcbX
MATITALNIYPVKSCRGISLRSASLTPAGFTHDREWMIVRGDGRFITQRDEPRLALIAPQVDDETLSLSAPGQPGVSVDVHNTRGAIEVTCWRDRCAAFDAGDDAAAWLQAFFGQPYRLVRFDPSSARRSDPQWTQGIEATNLFSDGFPWLLLSQASLDDLNARLQRPLPMNRFRPNIVIDGIAAYGEDAPADYVTKGIRLRGVKPCTRCVITTTDQAAGARDGTEPLQTLRQYRFNRELKGVLFGQNLIMLEGAGLTLQVGQQLEVAALQAGA